VHVFKLVILLLLLFCIQQANATDKIYDHLENNSYVVEYTNTTPTANEINNYFIKEIARNNFTNLSSTRFTYHYSVHTSIQKVSDYTFKVNAEIAGELCTGDVYYKGFDISDILIPERIDFNVKVINNNNYLIVREFSKLSRNDWNKFSAAFLFEMYDEDAEIFLELDDVNFYSANKDKEVFKQRLSYIDEYYSSLAFFEYGNTELNNLSLTPSSIVSNYIKIKELERIYNSISNADFITKLDFNQKRDSEFKLKKEEFRLNLARTYNNLEILITSSEFIELDLSYKAAARQYVNEISNYFEISQEVTHAHAPFFYNYGNVHYNQSLFNEYFSGLNKILLKTAYCNEIVSVTLRLESEIFYAFLDKASSFIENEQYFIAIGLLTNAKNIHQFYSASALPLDLHFYISKANYGIYDSYLHLIDRAIEIGNYNLAESYIQKAAKFQKENSTSIISSDYTTKISEKLVRLYINKGEILNESGEFEEAMYCFNQAHNICRDIGRYNHDYEIKHGLIAASNGTYSNLVAMAFVKFENDEVNSANGLINRAAELRATYPSRIDYSNQVDELRTKVDEFFYQDYVISGKDYLSAGNYNMAHDLFLKAFELEEISDFEVYDSLPYFFVQAATPYLIDQCELGEVKVLKNELDEAREIYDRCFYLQLEYGVDYNPELQASLTLLNNSIFYRHCNLANEDFDKIIDHFNNTIETGDFINAMKILDETNIVMSQNYYCDFDKGLVVELKNKYSPAAEYQELAIVAKEALDADDHEKFIETHKKLEELSSNYEVIRKMIEPMPLHYLFSVKKNLALIETAVKDYQSKDEFATALKLLKVLYANNYSDRDTKVIQQNLATRMAYVDRQMSSPNTDPKVIVENYTDGNEWYKYFTKTYIKNW